MNSNLVKIKVMAFCGQFQCLGKLSQKLMGILISISAMSAFGENICHYNDPHRDWRQFHYYGPTENNVCLQHCANTAGAVIGRTYTCEAIANRCYWTDQFGVTDTRGWISCRGYALSLIHI